MFVGQICAKSLLYKSVTEQQVSVYFNGDPLESFHSHNKLH